MGEAEEKKGLSEKQKIVAIWIGFSLHNAWVCGSMYSTQSVFDTSFNLPGAWGGSVAILYLASIITYCIAAFFAAAFDRQLIKLSYSFPLIACGALLTCVGTVLAPLAPLFSSASFIIECLSGVLTGIGSLTLVLFWGVVFARERTGVIAVCGSAAVVCGFAFNTLIVQSLPHPWGSCLCALLPLGEWIILKALAPTKEQDTVYEFHSMPTSKAKLGLILVAPIALLGFALGIHKYVSIQSTLSGSGGFESIVILLLAGSLTVSMFAFYKRLFPEGSWDKLFRRIIPVASCVSLIIAAVLYETAVLSDLFILVTYIFIEAELWVYYAYIAHKMHISPFFVIGLSRGILTLFMALGTISSLLLSPYYEGTPVGSFAELLISLVLIALGFSFMPRESTILHSIVSCPAVRLVSLDLEEKLGILDYKSQIKHNESAAPEAVMAAETPVEVVVASEEEPGKDQKPASSALDSAAQGPSSPVSEARRAIETPLNAPQPKGGHFSAKVKKLASIYLLTERETDILFELAKGVGVSYIQTKYYISESTVKTHVRNIYRKMNIHKRSELLQLLEEIDDYD